jgi:transcriptional regulator with XRE-family HTH domain
MSTISDDFDSSLARSLRALREARGWSLSELASQSGVSRAMIHKIERAEASPTAALLGRLSGAFGLTISQLLARAEAQGAMLVRADESREWMDPETGFRRTSLSPQAPGIRLELIRAELPPRTRIPLPASSYQFIEQQVLVMEGEFTLEEDGKLTRLGPGDCLAFGPPADRAFRNDADEPCRYLVALVRDQPTGRAQS